jgi:hypothetical protein
MDKFYDSITIDDFVRGILSASSDNTFGSVWEDCVTCNKCMFKEQCHEFCEIAEEYGKNPTCKEVINVLIGTTRPKDVTDLF